MTTLYKAHNQLYTRTADQQFPNLQKFWEHCEARKQAARTNWHAPAQLKVLPDNGNLRLEADAEAYRMNDWSFGQLCRLANVSKDTVNRLSSRTAGTVFDELLPGGEKPYQVYSAEGTAHSVHGASYTRVFDADVVDLAVEFTNEFEAPQEAVTGGTGLYAGEQDMFCFLVDPTGWIEIGGEAFAPGFFLWNSEVGRRSLGVQTFWFQAVCQNHIVWDAVEVVDYSRKHTANVGEAFDAIRSELTRLIERRDERRDAFARVLRRAMGTNFDPNIESLLDTLGKYGVRKALAARALEMAKQNSRLTIFSVVDALTRLSQEMKYAGERAEADLNASRILSIAA